MLRQAFLLFALWAMTESAYVDPSLKSALKSKGFANIFVSFNSGTSSALNAISLKQFSSRTDKINAIASSLQQHAIETQANVLQLLNSKPFIQVQSFWINNQIFIRNADLNLVKQLQEFSEIAEIVEEEILEIDVPIIEAVEDSPMQNEWNIEKIQAPKVWEEGNTGQGVRIATIDTGVRFTHEALRHNFHEKKGWFDPYQKTPTPNDNNGHGTHTTATIAGAKGVGVAPGASWLACKGCATSSCAQDALISCGQYVLCPTNADGSEPDCSLAPKVVSNSWGGGRGRPMYAEVIDAWEAAGIIPIFSNGNAGPSCNSANSPADNPKVIGVGSTTNSDSLSSFSSVGPSFYGTMKPEISAPGSSVRSAYNRADDSYTSLSGTSMAAPHVAGVVALLASENPEISYDEVKSFLFGGAETKLTPTGRNCGGVDDSTFPNHAFGHGRLDASASVKILRRNSN